MALLPLEAFVVFTLTTLTFQAHTNGAIRRSLKALHKPLNVTVLVHVATGMFEVLRYYIRRFTQSDGAEVRPDILDLTSMVIQSLTAYRLARDRAFVGDKSIIRPVYHTQATCRVLLTISSFVLNKPWMHRGSVMIVVGNIYPRLIIWVARRLRMGALERYNDIYTMAMFVGALPTMYDTGVPMGPQVFLAAFVAFVLLERWVAQKLVHRKALEANGISGREEGSGDGQSPLTKQAEDFVVDILCRGGFVETNLLKASKFWPYAAEPVPPNAGAKDIVRSPENLPIKVVFPVE